MIQTITDYQIVEANGSVHLQQQVKYKMEVGWQPVGPAHVVSTRELIDHDDTGYSIQQNVFYFCQTMVKYE